MKEKQEQTHIAQNKIKIKIKTRKWEKWGDASVFEAYTLRRTQTQTQTNSVPTKSMYVVSIYILYIQNMERHTDHASEIYALILSTQLFIYSLSVCFFLHYSNMNIEQ